MRLLLCLVLTLAMSSPAFADDVLKRNSLSKEEKLFGLSNFWREVTYNFGHKDQVPDLDWDAAYQDYIPRILATETDLDYYYELQRFCALLKDGHTNVYLPMDMRRAQDRMRLSLTYLDGKVVVDNVDQRLSKTLPIGSEILRYEGHDVQRYMADSVIPKISTSAPHMYPIIATSRLIRGAKGASAILTYQKPNGDKDQITLPFDRTASDFNWAQTPSWDRTVNVELEWLDGGIARVNINSFANEAVVNEFKEVLPQLRKAKGLIIDIRANRGGRSDYAAAILQYLTKKPFETATWRTPKHIAAFKAWGRGLEASEETEPYVAMAEGRGYHYGDSYEHQPADDPLNVPMAVLFGPFTASSAEDMLVMADKFDNLKTFGTPSFGSTGQPLFMDLPGGGSARISTKRDYYPDGREFIGRGVQPDVFIEKTIEDFRLDQDPVLDAAYAYLKSETAS